MMDKFTISMDHDVHLAVLATAKAQQRSRSNMIQWIVVDGLRLPDRGITPQQPPEEEAPQ